MVYLMCLAWRHDLACSLREAAVMWKRPLCFVNIHQKNGPGQGQFSLHPLQQVKDSCIFKKTPKTPYRVLCGMSATTYLAKPALSAILILKGPPSTIPCESQSHVNENPWWCEAGNQIAAWHWALCLPQGCLNKRRGSRKVQPLSGDS